MLKIAVSKGRILEQTLPLLSKAGINVASDELKSRKLILNTSEPEVKVIIVRATDAPVFVEHGAADLGVVGKDLLMEYSAKNIYELVDLGIAKCKLIVAAKDAKYIEKTPLKIATKYVNSAHKFLARQGLQAEIIKLYGSVELACASGLADGIVDIVDTGATLKANGLKPIMHINDISSRLIVNSAAFKLKNAQINYWLKKINSAL